MKKILFVQPIFCPDQKRTQRNIESVLSIADYFKKFPYENMEIVFGGWARDDEYWNEISSLIKEQFGVESQRFHSNLGKATIVNKLASGRDYDFMFTMDSDIVFQKFVPSMTQRLVGCAEQIEKLRNKPFGLISLNQMGQCCHLENTKKNQLEFVNNIGNVQYPEKIRWPDGPSGVAGGCLFLSRQLWDKIGGYKVFGVYAGDDAHLLLDCHTKGFTLQIIDSISIVHPHDDDVEYAKWKGTVCQRDTRTGVKKDISQQVKEAEDFWSKR
jgi:hypothetical protein